MEDSEFETREAVQEEGRRKRSEEIKDARRPSPQFVLLHLVVPDTNAVPKAPYSACGSQPIAQRIKEKTCVCNV